MIPPASPDLLTQNPRFAALHKTLCSKYLGSDASTRRLNADHETTSAHLDHQRVSLAKNRILLSAMSQADHIAPSSSAEPPSSSSSTSASAHPQRPPTAQLPSELLDLLALVIPFITHSPTLTPEEHSLLQADLTLFRTKHLENLSTHLSQHLIAQHARLAAAASSTLSAISPTTTTTTITNNNNDRQPPLPLLQHSTANLAAQIHTLTTHRDSLLQHQLRAALLQLTHAALATLRTLTHDLTAERLPWLESYVHGAETRFLLARAAFGLAVAKGLSAKVRVTALEMERDMLGGGGGGGGADEGRQGRVQDRMRELGEEEGRLRERERVLEEVLREFEDAEREEVGGGGGAGGVQQRGVLKRLGRRYGEVEREMEEVRADVERLRGELGESGMSGGRKGGGGVA